MNVEVYLAFYDGSKGLGWWRTFLVWIIQLGNTKISHVGLIFKFPWNISFCPFIIDGRPAILVREEKLKLLGSTLIEKHYIGNVNITVDDLFKLTTDARVGYWYKIVFWLWFGRFFGLDKKTAFCCTFFCADYLNKTFNYSFKNTIVPLNFYKEVKNDYSSYWRKS